MSNEPRKQHTPNCDTEQDRVRQRLMRLEDEVQTHVDACHAKELEFKAELHEKGKITWQMIFTAIGSLTAILAIAGTVHTLSLTPLQDGIDRNARDLQAHIETPAHPRALKLLGVFDERFETLRAELNGATSDRKHLSERIGDLRHDINNGLSQRILDKTEALRVIIEDLKSDFHEHETIFDHPLGLTTQIDAFKATTRIEISELKAQIAALKARLDVMQAKMTAADKS